MLDPKWTGTDFDRREMRTLNIDQVVRVSAPIMLCSASFHLTAVLAQLW